MKKSFISSQISELYKLVSDMKKEVSEIKKSLDIIPIDKKIDIDWIDNLTKEEINIILKKLNQAHLELTCKEYIDPSKEI